MTENFVDKLRTAPPSAIRKPYLLRTWGFDPDMRRCGWAVLETEITPGHPARPLYWNAGLIQATSVKLKGLAQVEYMISTIEHWSAEERSVAQQQAMVEGQEFYSGGHEDANDLIHLAQVAGALYARVSRTLRVSSSLILPRTWKGNKGKDGMHSRAREYLGSTGQANRFNALDDIYGKNAQHAMDALCMALWLMGRENKLPVFR